MANEFVFPNWFTAASASDEYTRRITNSTINMLATKAPADIVDTARMVLSPADLRLIELP